jgi:two-component system chemotaxis response regulator CheY
MNEFKGRKILVVDDDDFTREMYRDVFREAQFDVVEARDGMEGLDLAIKDTPDVIFTGIVMPRMDGFTLIESLRKNTATSRIPIIMSSHLGREEDRKKAEQLGVRDFIVRDLTPPKEVVGIVSKVFSVGESYVLNFDAYNMDAPELAKDLNLNSNYQCMECDEKMTLKLKLDKTERGWYKAKFTCPKCGWHLP